MYCKLYRLCFAPDASHAARLPCQHPAIIYCILFQTDMVNRGDGAKNHRQTSLLGCERELEFCSFPAPGPEPSLLDKVVRKEARLMNDSFVPTLKAAVQDSMALLVIHARYQWHPTGIFRAFPMAFPAAACQRSDLTAQIGSSVLLNSLNLLILTGFVTLRSFRRPRRHPLQVRAISDLMETDTVGLKQP